MSRRARAWCGRKAFRHEALNPLTVEAVAMGEREREREREREGVFCLKGPPNQSTFPPCKVQSIKQELGQLWSCEARANSILAFGHWAQPNQRERERERERAPLSNGDNLSTSRLDLRLSTLERSSRRG